MSGRDDRVLIGVITGAHGVRGEVKIRSYADEPSDIGVYRPLRTASGEPVVITALKPLKDGFIARIKGVADRNAAEALRGQELFVGRGQLPEVEAGEVYVHDLIGAAVHMKGGTLVGEVLGIANYGAGDLIEVRFAGRKETVLVPFADPFVPDIDLENRVLTLDLPEDYFD